MKWVKENQKSYQWIATFPSDTPFFETSIIDEYQKRIKLKDSLLYFVKVKQQKTQYFWFVVN